MGERYWITGVQLAMLVFDTQNAIQLKDKIIEEQFIGNYESDTDKDKFISEIKKLVNKKSV
jgi:hypothetical protein